MKNKMTLVLDETVWNGATREEGEDPLYDKYTEWESSKEAERLVDKITKYLKEWDSECDLEGGTLYHLNGVLWYFNIECPKEELQSIKSMIYGFLNKIENDKDFKSCPVELEFYLVND